MNYLIVYNHTQSSFPATDIHKTITTMLEASDWWHYLPNVYIVNTSRYEKFIADKMIHKHPGLLFLTTVVDLRRSNGVLNKNAWDWISRKTRSLLKIKPTPQPPSTSLENILGLSLPPIKPSSQSQFIDSLLKDWNKNK